MMILAELEKKLETHAERTKKAIEPSFDIENGEMIMKTNKKRAKIVLLLCAAVALILGTTVFAAYKYLSARQAAVLMGDDKLAECFEGSEAQSETVTDGKYCATVLGIVSGENLSKFESSAWEVFPERTYAVVAIERADKTDMTYDDEVLVTPLIEGLEPWKYNVFTMNGGYQAIIKDGVLYRIVEFDSIEYFADRHVYLAVLSDTFYDNAAFDYDEKTGLITENKAYEGTNILFDLKLDKQKANPAAAEKYLKTLKEQQESGAESENEAEINDGGNEVEITINSDMTVTSNEPILEENEEAEIKINPDFSA